MPESDYAATASLRIVTPAQYAEGHLEKKGGFIYTRRFVLVGKTPEGNFIVRELQVAP